MKHYVLGLIFDVDSSHVLLIKKERPDWMKGRWNGIGGKIEKDETPYDAMKRECQEEISCSYNFEHKITFTCPGGTVYVFAATSRGPISFEQTEDEELVIWLLKHLPEKIMGNLKWIIPLCLSSVQTPVMINQHNLGVID